MRIAFFHELPVGGALRAVNELAGQMKRKHTVDLFYISSNKIKDHDSFFSNIRYFQFETKKWSGKNWRVRLFKDTFELLLLRRLHKKIAGILKKGKYDIVFMHASQFTQSPFLLRENLKNKIFYLHDPHYRFLYEKVLESNNLDTIRKIYDRLNRFVRKRIDIANVNSSNLVIANSIYTKRTFGKTYGLKSQVGYLGVDEKFFKPKRSKRKFDVLFIGSKERIDGLDLLNKSEKFFKQKIIIRKVLKEDEWISNDRELRNLYQSSKIVVCLAYHEPLGLVALEAMSCGIPVIAVNEGGYKETVINGKTGYLIKRNPKDLSSKIMKLLNDEKLYNKISFASRKSIENKWTWKMSAGNLEKIFKGLIVP